MKGIVLKVDIDDNSALLIDHAKTKFTFSLDDCVGFEAYPQAGEEVEFGLDGDDKVYFVECILNEDDENKVFKKEKGLVEEVTLKKNNIEIQLNIPITKSISDCLDNYFGYVVSRVKEYEATFEEDETLDFLLMQRFLNTAYNNLKDIDSTFTDEYLLELRSDLISLEKIYKKFSHKNTVPEIAYENIFLEQQVIYQNNTKRMLSNSSEIKTLEVTIKSLERHIASLEKEINSNNLNKSFLEVKINDLKRHRGYYVDSLHKSANLKQENIQLKKSIESFANKHKDEFINVYQKEAKSYDEFIIEQLNGYSYEYDKVMWERAEESSAIRSFFKKSNIEDDYSSRTFLKYFIKSLDSGKFSKEHQRLNDLLEYLDSRAKMRMLIVSEVLVESEQIKHLIRSVDKDYIVEKTDKPRSVYFRSDLKKADIIFIDLAIKYPTIFEFIDMLQKRIEQEKGKAVLCVISNSFTKESLIKLKQKNIIHLLDTRLNDSELILNVKKIIEEINE